MLILLCKQTRTIKRNVFMKILIHIAVALFIFSSTILAGNPYIICKFTKNNNNDTNLSIKKPKGCGECRMSKAVEKSCYSGEKQTNCSISTESALKKKCACPTSLPMHSAVLQEIKLPTPTKTIVRFNSDYFNTSNTFKCDFSKSSPLIGIHNTISSTILLL